MSEWEKIKLKHLTTKIGSGATPKGGQEAYHNSGISLIRSQNVLDFEFSNNGLAFIDEDQAQKLGNVIVEDGDVLINITGDSVARVCKVPSDILPARVNQHVSIIRAYSEKLDSDFLLYFLLNPIFKMHLLRLASHGATRNALTKSDLENLLILVPSLEEQKSVADVLSCLDRKIENLRKQNKTLEVIAQTLFKHWFVDFEFPNEDGKPYKSSGGEMVRSELGEISADWRVGKLGDIADVKSSKRIFFSEYVEFGIPFYRSKEIIELSSGQEISTSLYISEERFREIESIFGVPGVGEILVTSVGTIGVTYIVSSTDKFYFKDGNLTWINNFRDGFNGVVIYYWLKSDSAKNQIEQNTIGSTQKALTIQALRGLNLILPDSKLLSRYRDFVESIHNKRESNTQQIRTLTKTRDILLPQLMSGKLRITQ
jgi:type I restriction enzyme S subunit